MRTASRKNAKARPEHADICTSLHSHAQICSPRECRALRARRTARSSAAAAPIGTGPAAPAAPAPRVRPLRDTVRPRLLLTTPSDHAHPVATPISVATPPSWPHPHLGIPNPPEITRGPKILEGPQNLLGTLENPFEIPKPPQDSKTLLGPQKPLWDPKSFQVPPPFPKPRPPADSTTPTARRSCAPCRSVSATPAALATPTGDTSREAWPSVTWGRG